jgi:hypothetical protein
MEDINLTDESNKAPFVSLGSPEGRKSARVVYRVLDTHLQQNSLRHYEDNRILGFNTMLAVVTVTICILLPVYT